MSPDHLSRESVIGLLGDLVRIPSVNPTLAPDEAHTERAIAVFACDWLNARGVRAWQEEAAPGRPNVAAEVGRPDGEGPTLVLYGHLDTVGTAGMTIPPFEPREESGRVYGRGTYDMKGGVAACMSAAAALAREDFGGRVLLALVADEEYESIGAADFARRHKADGCVVTESSHDRLIVAHKGFVWADIVTHGRAVHGSRYDLGLSAIARMGRIIAALDQFDAEVLRKRQAPLVGAASMHPAIVQGGVGISTYAPTCTLQVERRTLPGETAEQVRAEFVRVIRDAGEEADVTLRTVRGPLLPQPDAPIARATIEAITAVTGAAPELAGAPYWMDSAIFADAGIPSVNYGPTGAGAHEPVEWVDAQSVVTCARVLVETARRFGRPGAAP